MKNRTERQTGGAREQLLSRTFPSTGLGVQAVQESVHKWLYIWNVTRLEFDDLGTWSIGLPQFAHTQKMCFRNIVCN